MKSTLRSHAQQEELNAAMKSKVTYWLRLLLKIKRSREALSRSGPLQYYHLNRLHRLSAPGCTGHRLLIGSLIIWIVPKGKVPPLVCMLTTWHSTWLQERGWGSNSHAHAHAYPERPTRVNAHVPRSIFSLAA